MFIGKDLRSDIFEREEEEFEVIFVISQRNEGEVPEGCCAFGVIGGGEWEGGEAEGRFVLSGVFKCFL